MIPKLTGTKIKLYYESKPPLSVAKKWRNHLAIVLVYYACHRGLAWSVLQTSSSMYYSYGIYYSAHIIPTNWLCYNILICDKLSNKNNNFIVLLGGSDCIINKLSTLCSDTPTGYKMTLFIQLFQLVSVLFYCHFDL